MESGAKNPLEPVQEIYDQVLDPEKSIELLAELEKVKAEGETGAKRSAYESIVRLCEYLNKWNGVDKTVLIEAENEIKSALAFDANLAIAHYAMGFVHRAYGRHPEALESFTKAIEIKDDYPRAHAQRGAELLYLGRPEEALPEVQKAIDLKPDSPTVGMYQWILGRTFFFMGDYVKAISHLRQSVATWQDLWYNRLYLVSAYALTGDHESAQRELEAFTSKFGSYSVTKVQDNERTNPNKDPFVVDGRRRFHEGLVQAGMPLATSDQHGSAVDIQSSNGPTREAARPLGLEDQFQLLEDKIRTFEANKDWRVCLTARGTIQQGLISLTVDTLGMGEIIGSTQRQAAVQKALQTLPGFLEHLVTVAKPLAEQAEKRGSSNSRTIGGILVLQHVKTWALMFGCPCWPV